METHNILKCSKLNTKVLDNFKCHNFELGYPIEAHNRSKCSKLNKETLAKFKWP